MDKIIGGSYSSKTAGCGTPGVGTAPPDKAAKTETINMYDSPYTPNREYYTEESAHKSKTEHRKRKVRWVAKGSVDTSPQPNRTRSPPKGQRPVTTGSRNSSSVAVIGNRDTKLPQDAPIPDNPNRQGRDFALTCFNCQSKDHLQRDCPIRRCPRCAKYHVGRCKEICGLCGVKGHIASKCKRKSLLKPCASCGVVGHTSRVCRNKSSDVADKPGVSKKMASVIHETDPKITYYESLLQSDPKDFTFSDLDKLEMDQIVVILRLAAQHGNRLGCLEVKMVDDLRKGAPVACEALVTVEPKPKEEKKKKEEKEVVPRGKIMRNVAVYVDRIVLEKHPYYSSKVTQCEITTSKLAIEPKMEKQLPSFTLTDDYPRQITQLPAKPFPEAPPAPVWLPSFGNDSSTGPNDGYTGGVGSYSSCGSSSSSSSDTESSKGKGKDTSSSSASDTESSKGRGKASTSSEDEFSEYVSASDDHSSNFDDWCYMRDPAWHTKDNTPLPIYPITAPEPGWSMPRMDIAIPYGVDFDDDGFGEFKSHRTVTPQVPCVAADGVMTAILSEGLYMNPGTTRLDSAASTFLDKPRRVTRQPVASPYALQVTGQNYRFEIKPNEFQDHLKTIQKRIDFLNSEICHDTIDYRVSMSHLENAKLCLAQQKLADLEVVIADVSSLIRPVPVRNHDTEGPIDTFLDWFSPSLHDKFFLTCKFYERVKPNDFRTLRDAEEPLEDTVWYTGRLELSSMCSKSKKKRNLVLTKQPIGLLPEGFLPTNRFGQVRDVVICQAMFFQITQRQTVMLNMQDWFIRSKRMLESCKGVTIDINGYLHAGENTFLDTYWLCALLKKKSKVQELAYETIVDFRLFPPPGGSI